MGPWAELSCAVLCCARAGLGRAASALVLVLCSSLLGSGRVQGCYSVTGPLHRHYTPLKTRTDTNTHARSPHFNPPPPHWFVCMEYGGHITVTDNLTRHRKHTVGSSKFFFFCCWGGPVWSSFLCVCASLHASVWVTACKLVMWRSPSKADERGSSVWALIGAIRAPCVRVCVCLVNHNGAALCSAQRWKPMRHVCEVACL